MIKQLRVLFAEFTEMSQQLRVLLAEFTEMIKQLRVLLAEFTEMSQQLRVLFAEFTEMSSLEVGWVKQSATQHGSGCWVALHFTQPTKS